MSRLPERPGADDSSHGVIVERRAFLLAGVAGLFAAGGASAPAPPADPGPALSLEEFVHVVRPHAERLVAADRADEDAYLRTLADLLPRVTGLSATRFRRARPGLAVHPAYRFPPLVVVQLRLEPGAAIGLHDHRGCNGVLCGLGGQVRVRNFEFLDAAAARRSCRAFRVRHTRTGVLTAGRCATLGRQRDNLHELVAGPDGARLLDVFTVFDPTGQSADVDLRDRPLPGNNGVYEATWKG